MAMIPAPPSDPWPGRGRKGPGARDSRSSSFPRSTPGPGASYSGSNDDLLASASFRSIRNEYRAAWARGAEPQVEDYLSRLRADRPEHRVELIFEAFLLAEEAGLDPSPEAYVARFPDDARALERVLALHRGFSSSRLRLCMGPNLPEPGDEIGPYRLVRELGRGGLARVFLAEQADLDDRLVVVKVSNRVTPEPRLLARGAPAHIVELCWHGLVDGGALNPVHALHGGATLAQVLQDRRGAERPRPRTGREFLDELDAVSAPEHPRPASARTSRELIAGLSYPRAAAWVVARLAEALDFAFDRDVIHGDVKPSNVLMTAHGVPMLLDFNLSVGCRDGVDDGPGEDLGGTLAYMAPERLSNLAGPGELPLPTTADRHRSDIYSLGMLLLELLTGKPPELPRQEGQAVPLKELASAYVVSRRQGGAVMIRASQASVAGGLRAILERCLNPDPSLRYRRAADLAADLDCWRNDLPTPYTREPGPLHALARWSRRRRIALVIGSLLLAFSATACAALWAAAEKNWGIAYAASALFRKLLDDSELGALQLRRQFGKAPLTRDPSGRAAHHLRVYGLFDPSDWRARDEFVYLPASDQAELEAFLLEQAVRYAHALSTRTQTSADLKRALESLDRAAGRLAIPVVDARRRALRTRLGLAEPAGKGRRESPWLENYLSGVEAELTPGPLGEPDWTEAPGLVPTLPRRAPRLFRELPRRWPRVALSRFQEAETSLRAASPFARTGRAAAAVRHPPADRGRRPGRERPVRPGRPHQPGLPGNVPIAVVPPPEARPDRGFPNGRLPVRDAPGA
ncbi:MAG: protein kinase [Isosphaeraceae bacterium]